MFNIFLGVVGIITLIVMAVLVAAGMILVRTLEDL